MKFLLALLLVAAPAFAEPNIKEGNVEVNGSFNLSRSTSSGSGTYFNIQTIGQYFIKDHLSLGADISYYTYRRNSSLAIGPAATLYFAVKENLAPYITLTPITWTNTSGYSHNLISSTVRAGVKFFLTDSVAFGPAVEYYHFWEQHGMRSSGNISLLGVFSIHL